MPGTVFASITMICAVEHRLVSHTSRYEDRNRHLYSAAIGPQPRKLKRVENWGL